MTTLTKTTYVSTTPAVDSTPGQPYIPAHWAVVTTTTRVPTYRYDPVSGLYIFDGYAVVTETRNVWIPAQPYIAPTPGSAGGSTTDLNLGWNSGAYSIGTLAHDGDVAFSTTPGATGVVAGLSNHPALNADFDDIPHAWYVSYGQASVYESGVLKTGPVTVSDASVLRVQRALGKIKYYVDSTLTHTSDATFAGSGAMDVSLFSGGDGVAGASITDEVFGSVVTAARVPVVGSGDGSSSFVTITALPPTVLAGHTSSGAAVFALPPAVLAADYAYYAAVVVALPSVVLIQEAAPLVPAYSYVDILSLVPVVGAYGPAGIYGSAEITALAPRMLAADYNYAEVRVTAYPAVVNVNGYEAAGQALVATLLGFGSAAHAQVAGTEVLSSGLRIGSTIDAQNVVTALVECSFAVGSAVIIAVEVSIVVNSRIGFGATIADTEYDAMTWVMSLDNYTTRYVNFPFNSYTKLGAKYYGVKRDGMYLLEGDDDAGELINSYVDFGLQDFGSMELKRVDNAYFTVKSEGDTALQVSANGCRYLYAALPCNLTDNTRRFDVGRGICASRIGFAMLNIKGCAFELASVEFVGVKASRRVS